MHPDEIIGRQGGEHVGQGHAGAHLPVLFMNEQQVGIGSENVRAPRLTLVGEEREQILKIINDGISSRPSLPDYLNL